MTMELLKKAIDDLGAANAEFRKENDKRLSEIEKKGRADPLLEEKVDKMALGLGELAKVKAQLDDLLTKGGRPGKGADDEQAEIRKEFSDGFLRKGRTEKLEALRVKGVSAGSDPDGGWAVPADVDKMISAVEQDATPMRAECTVLTVSNEKYEKLLGQHGVSSGWVGEAAARPETNSPTLAKIAPAFGEIYANPATTQKALDDVSFNVEQWLADEVGAEFALQENEAFTASTGTGVNRPKGILAYTVTASPTFGQLQLVKSGSSGVFIADKLIDTVHTLKKGYRNGAKWMMATLAMAAIRKLKGSTNDAYLFQESLRAGEPATLLGYPIIENEDMPAVAASSYSAIFGNFKRGYLIADVQGTRVLRDPFTNKPFVMFYSTKRVGGAVADSTALVVHQLAA